MEPDDEATVAMKGLPVPATSPAPPTRRRRACLAQSLGILALVAAVAACGSDPSPAPADSGVDDAGPTAEAGEEAPSTRTTNKEETTAPADAGAGRFGIDQDTTMREVFDTLASAEQACIREALDDDVLESMLDTPVLFANEDGMGPSILSCLDPDTAREFFLSVAMATMVAGAEQAGLSTKTGKDQQACMRDLLAGVDVAALASEPESDGFEEYDVSGLIGLSDLSLGLFACIPDLLVASMGDLTPEQESCVRDLAADVVAGDYRSGLASDPELAAMLESDPALASLGPVLGLSFDLIACGPDETFDADPSPVPGESGDAGSDDHADALDWATPVGIGETAPGAINSAGDIDYFVFWAESGRLYQIDVVLGSLPDSTAALYAPDGFELAFNDDYDETTASRIHWYADYTGDHYVAVEGYDGDTGAYALTVTPADDHGFNAIAAGGNHTCALRTDGTVACWGDNGAGQADAAEGGFKAVAAGWDHTCGLRTDGTVACWGDNDHGQTDAAEGGFKAVAAGWDHTCGLRTGNTVACWGRNDHGQTDAAEGGFSDVTASGEHTCGLRTNTITCWGRNDHGQADPPTGTFKAVTAGLLHTCGLRTDNTIACWGDNRGGQADAAEGAFKAVAAGGNHTCGLRTDGTIACWGHNPSGQADAPAGAFKAVAGGGNHACGLRTDGTIACWGHNDHGQADPPTVDESGAALG